MAGLRARVQEFVVQVLQDRLYKEPFEFPVPLSECITATLKFSRSQCPEASKG